MWNHWSYKDKSPDDLEQGDVLKPNDELLNLVRQYHPYYAAHPKNQFYIVLTQSCDLVRRCGPCTARYIALAPVRSLRNIVELEYGDKVRKVDGVAYASNRIRGDVERFLARLFNNNEPSYYYLEQEQAAGLAEPMCAMLALPISFKSQHYDCFVGARLIGIGDEFQAKLGSSLGQLYSRVGTRDFPEEQMSTKISGITNNLALWLDTADVDVLDRLVQEHRDSHPGATMDNDVLASLVNKIPKKKAAVIDLILEIATSVQIVGSPSPEKYKLRRSLENNAAFASHFRV